MFPKSSKKIFRLFYSQYLQFKTVGCFEFNRLSLNPKSPMFILFKYELNSLHNYYEIKCDSILMILKKKKGCLFL